MPPPSPLTRAQTHALFDIVTHHQVYAEIEAFKLPDAIATYGHPFAKDDGVATTSPLLQCMLNKFVLRLPGLTNVGAGFWDKKVKALVEALADAELSESYDKGAIGARRALATAISSMLEGVARGILGGWPGGNDRKEDVEYNLAEADDVLRGWNAAVGGAVYGHLIDVVFTQTATTGNLEDHPSVIRAAHEYLLLGLASFLHHVFIMSPDGQYLVRLLENVHRLVPYYLVKQTLRVGNAATMINGMVKLVLTKISVTAATNWMGLTNNTNDGMNLMQQIISTVMAWDTSEFQKRAQKLEAQRDAPDKQVFKAIRAYVYASRDTHDAGRNISIQESKSIVAVILETADPPIEPETLTEHQHQIAMEHYSTMLSIRDREQLTKVLCKMQPDLLTSAIRDLVLAFDPVIRAVHNAVDLSGTVTDAENFLGDLIKISKPRRGAGSAAASTNTSRSGSPGPSAIPADAPASVTDSKIDGAHAHIPTVEEYVHLLRKHAPSAHKFLHQVVKNAPELAEKYREFAKACVAEFRSDGSNPGNDEDGEGGDGGGAGNMTGPLHALFSSLPSEKQEQIKPLLDHHAKYLEHLNAISHSRLQSLVTSTNPNSSSKPAHHHKGIVHGPGIFLSRWHALLDSTLITPASPHGPVRRGFEVKGELDGKGFKVDSLLNHSKGGSKGKQSFSLMHLADGTGDGRERQERRRDGREEERLKEVWEAVREPWVGVCKGLEVVGD